MTKKKSPSASKVDIPSALPTWWRPTKPRKPTPPVEPKKVFDEKRVCVDNLYCSKTIDLRNPKYKDVVLIEFERYYNNASVNLCSLVKEENPNYDKELEEYKKKLQEYQKALADWEEKMKEWAKYKPLYDQKQKEKKRAKLEKEIQDRQKELDSLTDKGDGMSGILGTAFGNCGG